MNLPQSLKTVAETNCSTTKHKITTTILRDIMTIYWSHEKGRRKIRVITTNLIYVVHAIAKYCHMEPDQKWYDHYLTRT